MQPKVKDYLVENKKTLILSIGPILVLLVFIFIHLPLATGLVNKGYRIYQLTQKYNSLDEIENEITNLKKNNQVLLNQSRVTSPGGKESNKLSNIMNLLNTKLKENKLLAVSIKPQEENQEKDFVILPFEIELYGNYHSFGKFLSDIESSTVPLRVTGFEINSRDNVSVNLDFKLKLSAYLLKG